jgi:sortase (surface protein transpeptidase)
VSRSAALARPAIASPARTTSTTTGSTATGARSAAAPAPARNIYRGRNHVWIPSLGINRSISSFACTRSRPPDNYVYRWGCAGSNNVYLLGHAYSVFKPLHDAYVGGRLKKGMKVFYADGSGHVTTYAVAWWKVTRPTSSASWAWAAQSRPSMTLQTCLGARSELRLIVRLVAVD